jgi:cytochrome c553
MKLAANPVSSFRGASFPLAGTGENAGSKLTLLLIIALLATSSAFGEDATPEQLAFFEKTIRPVLVTHCYECHAANAENLQGGLLVDSRVGLLAGGDSGPAVVPRDVDESLLISALRYDGFEMPPNRKLPQAVIADFERWIREGAADPRQGGATATQPREIDIEAGRLHWAYQPVKTPVVPTVKNTAWPANDIDRFILARLEASGLKPAADASQVVLVRRLYFSLIGLPPTPQQIEEFVNDKSPRAYERLVDRLLDSPYFGERWGRHWLDVVRFAESLTLRGLVLRESWRYRDYVIESFNEDRSFDRFITEQLAGDLLEDSSIDARRRNLIATTFLTMGNSNLEDQDKKKLEMDYVDEQLDVIGRGLLAQTITCARCHDHKFDPIPTRDYYAMAGILKNVQALKHANVSRWVEVPLPVSDEVQQMLDQHKQAVAALENSIAKLKQRLAPAATKPVINIVAVADLPGVVIDDTDARKVGNWKDSQSVKNYVGQGYCHDESTGKGRKTLTFLPRLPRDGRYEVRFAYSHAGNRATDVPVTVFSADGEMTIGVNQKEPPPIDGRFMSLGVFRFEVAGQSFVMVTNEGTTGYVIADAIQFIPVDEDGRANVDRNTAGADSKREDDKDVAPQNVASMTKKLASMKAELAKLRKAAPEVPMAMSVVEGTKGKDLPIHIRGNVHNLGDVVPRGVLQVATYGEVPTMPADGSGRLELARWMVHPRHPLTSRVMANRVWHWLVGVGLVRTVDNFGTTGEPPSHPELLDHLAAQFIQEGWSVKQLIRTIVLSRTYRLSSSSAKLKSDPENRLLSQMNRNRLDAESLRDAMLAAAGALDLAMGGRTFSANLSSDYRFAYNEPRRSVYAPVFRNSLPEIFEVFDFANPSMVTGRRNVSTVAPQALFLMNHPFVREQAQRTAERLLAENVDGERSRINRAFLLTLSRRATDAEIALSERFLTSGAADSSRAEAWTQIVQSLFASIEFRYLR